MTRTFAKELAALYTACLLINLLLWPGNWGFIGVQPHPYLLAVALLAGRHGPRLGLAGSLVGALLYEVLGAFPDPLAAPHNAILASLVLASAVLGRVYADLRRQLEQARGREQEAQARLQLISSQDAALESANRELRSQISSQPESLESLYERARQLTALAPEQLYGAALELVVERTQAQECGFYLVEREGLRKVAQVGTRALPERLPEGPLVSRALRERRLVSALQDLPEGAGAEDPLLAIPLFSESTGQALAVLTIQQLSFQRFTPHTLKVLGVIADWSARALGQLTPADERLAQEERAHAELVERLSRRRLTPRDLAYLEGIAQPLAGRLLQTLEASREDRVTRANALAVLERIQGYLSGEDVGFLRDFVRRELEWLVQNHFHLQVLERCREREALELLRFYLRQQQRGLASQLLSARNILLQVEKELDAGQLRAALHPLLHPGEGDARTAAACLEEWAGREFAQAFQMVVGLGAGFEGQLAQGYGQRSVEELCLEFLGRRDRWLVSATLHGLGELARRNLRISQLGPGTPAAEALRLTHSADPNIREAAIECLASLYDGSPMPGLVRETLLRALSDPEERVRELARALQAMTTSG